MSTSLTQIHPKFANLTMPIFVPEFASCAEFATLVLLVMLHDRGAHYMISSTGWQTCFDWHGRAVFKSEAISLDSLPTIPYKPSPSAIARRCLKPR